MGIVSKINKKILLCLLENNFKKSRLNNKYSELINQYLPYTSSVETTNKEWLNNELYLKKKLSTSDFRFFLQWDVIRNTMFVSNASYTEKEYLEIRNSDQWDNRWNKAIKESIVGLPDFSQICPFASGNSIHHSYHLYKYESSIKKQVTDFDIIFEFGGGYGSMARIISELGFTGIYIIFDLPLFSLIQALYLKENGLNVSLNIGKISKSKQFLCISNYDDLQKIKLIKESKNKLFISTWALSETNNLIRDRFYPTLQLFENYLLAYQHCFSGINNVEYFKNLAKSELLTNVNWDLSEIPFIKNSYYLFGSKILQ